MKINCPDCNRGNEITKPNDKVKCRRCHQYIEIKDFKPIKCIPKALI